MSRPDAIQNAIKPRALPVNRLIWLLIRIVLVTSLCVWLASRIDLAPLLIALRQINTPWLYLVPALWLIAFTLASLRWKLLLTRFSGSVSLAAVALFNLVGAFYSSFIPGNVSGDVIKGLYLSRAHVRRVDAVSSALADRLLGLAVTVWIGLFALLVTPEVRQATQISEAGVGGLLLIALALPVVGLLILPRFAPLRARMPQAIQLVYDVGMAYARTPRRLILSCIVSVLYFLCWVAILWVIGLAVRLEGVSLVSMAFVLAIVNLAQAVPISINGLGVREGALLVLLPLYGVSNEKAVIFSLLIAALGWCVALVGALVVIADVRLQQPRTAASAETSSRADPASRRLEHIDLSSERRVQRMSENSAQRVKQAKALVARGEFAKARMIISSIDHPSKQRWIAQIDAQAAHAQQGRKFKQHGSFGVAAVSSVIIVIGLVALALILARPAQTTITPIPTLRLVAGQPANLNTVNVSSDYGASAPALKDNAAEVAAVQEATPEPSPTATATPIPDLETVQVPLNRPVTSDQVLRLVDFSFERTPRNLISVTLQVENVSDTAQTGAAWYFMSLPGSEEPWVDPAYMSPKQPIEDLAPGDTATLSFDGLPENFGTGEYSLSAWVHGVDPATGEDTHQDGESYWEPIVVVPAYALSIGEVASAPNGNETTITLKLSATNNTVDSADLAFSYSLAYSTTSLSGDTDYQQPQVVFYLPAGASHSQTFNITLPLDSGNYELTAWLYRYFGSAGSPIVGMPYPELIAIP